MSDTAACWSNVTLRDPDVRIFCQRRGEHDVHQHESYGRVPGDGPEVLVTITWTNHVE